MNLFLAVAALLSSAIAAPRVAIVPGCPTEEDGTLTFCLERRILWAYSLWEDGRVDWFITSGNAVYTPYVEAHAMAAGLVALGVPADRIWLEPRALHTDENMHNAMLFAEARGWDLYVATDGLQARSGCWMIRAWGRECEAFPIDEHRLDHAFEEHADRLDGVTAPRAEGFIPLRERHEARAALTGKRRRPNSLWLYHTDLWRRLVGKVRIPYTPDGVADARTWAEELARRAE